MLHNRERGRPDEGAASESWWEPDDDSVAPVRPQAPYALAWPPADGTAAEPVTIDELDRRRRAYFELQAFLRDAA